MRIAIIAILAGASIAQAGIPLIGDENIAVDGDVVEKTTPTTWGEWPNDDFQSGCQLPRDWTLQAKTVGEPDFSQDPRGSYRRREALMVGVAVNPMPRPTHLNIRYGFLIGTDYFQWFTNIGGVLQFSEIERMDRQDVFRIEKRGGVVHWLRNRKLVHSVRGQPVSQRYYVDGKIGYQGNEFEVIAQ